MGEEIFGKLAQRVAVEKEVRLIEIDLQIVVHHQRRQRFSGPLPAYCNAQTPAESSAIAPKPTRP